MIEVLIVNSQVSTNWIPILVASFSWVTSWTKTFVIARIAICVIPEFAKCPWPTTIVIIVVDIFGIGAIAILSGLVIAKSLLESIISARIRITIDVEVILKHDKKVKRLRLTKIAIILDNVLTFLFGVSFAKLLNWSNSFFAGWPITPLFAMGWPSCWTEMGKLKLAFGLSQMPFSPNGGRRSGGCCVGNPCWFKPTGVLGGGGMVVKRGFRKGDEGEGDSGKDMVCKDRRGVINDPVGQKWFSLAFEILWRTDGQFMWLLPAVTVVSLVDKKIQAYRIPWATSSRPRCGF